MSDFVVVSTRGSLGESEHLVSAAVVSADGRVAGHAGDPLLATFWRSAAKPFQLMPLVEDGGIARFGLDSAMLALACGSHNAEPVHRAVVARWLEAVGISEADLACGGHSSLWPVLAATMIHDDILATPSWSNCSGKHASLLALAVLHGWSLRGYEELGHPVQQRVAETIAKWSGVPEDRLVWGVDGCTAAAVALPISAMALAYARLGASADTAATSIREAMMAEPYLVGGAERLDTTLMEAWKDRVIAKIGAEGVYSASLPTLGLGVALKVHDGDMKAAEIACVSLLNSVVGKFAPGESWPEEALRPWLAPPIRNTRGTITGHFEVRGGVRWD